METLNRFEELVSGHPFFAGIESRALTHLGLWATVRRFGSHQQIFAEGADADHLYLILSGRIVLETSAGDCGRIVIETLGSGDTLGWSWLFPPYRWCFTATTTAPTEVISFGADALRQAVEADPQFGHDLLQRVARTVIDRLQNTRQALSRAYSNPSAAQRP